jgi:hypothetical protein
MSKINLSETQKAIVAVAARIVVPLAAVIATDVIVKKIVNKETPAE